MSKENSYSVLSTAGGHSRLGIIATWEMWSLPITPSLPGRTFLVVLFRPSIQPWNMGTSHKKEP